MNHPKFLKNQIRKELTLSVTGFPITTFFTVPWFVGEVRGYSRLYENVDDYGWLYIPISALLFLFFTDMCIYWIHRWIHHPLIYKHLHKPHHRWIIPTPYSSHAFHPLDGYVQSVPYHLFIYIFPLQKYIYIVSFVFVNLWTVMIHDGTFINGAAHHALHHLYFNYNYGQYFTIWDKIGNSHRLPGEEQYDINKRKDGKIWQKQAKEVDVSFVFVNLWTVMIHDGTFINGAAHHALHHLYFNYNYGQYFTIWDKIGNSHRLPGEEQYDINKRKDGKIWQKQAKEVDGFDENGKEKKLSKKSIKKKHL
ncbi:7627_t:CDS:2 [Entrophospora sp. SA101]|nr:7627_t:CDS:2 [Entrophospora sp. SA101]